MTEWVWWSLTDLARVAFVNGSLAPFMHDVARHRLDKTLPICKTNKYSNRLQTRRVPFKANRIAFSRDDFVCISPKLTWILIITVYIKCNELYML